MSVVFRFLAIMIATLILVTVISIRSCGDDCDTDRCAPAFNR